MAILAVLTTFVSGLSSQPWWVMLCMVPLLLSQSWFVPNAYRNRSSHNLTIDQMPTIVGISVLQAVLISGLTFGAGRLIGSLIAS
jgi:hypothetical protein